MSYDTDIVAWADGQSQALRARSANALDWDNLAEEMDSLGRAETSAVTELLTQAVVAKLIHRAAAPALARAAKRHRKSMHIDLQNDVHVTAVRDAQSYMPGVTLPATCPWTLDELLAEGEATRAAVGR